MTASGYSVPKQITKRTLIFEVKRTVCPIPLVDEKADVCGGHEKLGKVTMSEVKRSNESQSSLKRTRSHADRMVYRYAERKVLNNADRCMLHNQ